MSDIQDYDAGLLNDFGGGNVEWWQDYIRAEIGRANDYWREQVADQVWRLIESAPKDGNRLILGGCTNGPSVREGYWGAGRFNRKTKTYDRDWTDGGSWGFNPTHWMPLPASPNTPTPERER